MKNQTEYEIILNPQLSERSYYMTGDRAISFHKYWGGQLIDRSTGKIVYKELVSTVEADSQLVTFE